MELSPAHPSTSLQSLQKRSHSAPSSPFRDLKRQKHYTIRTNKFTHKTYGPLVVEGAYLQIAKTNVQSFFLVENEGIVSTTLVNPSIIQDIRLVTIVSQTIALMISIERNSRTPYRMRQGYQNLLYCSANSIKSIHPI